MDSSLVPGGRTLLIRRGRRFVRRAQPATLIYGGAELPCNTGNEDFFERLETGGFRGVRGLFVILLRCDISPGMVFTRGQNIQVRDDESKDIYNLQVGESNSRSAATLILNLEAPPS